MFPEVLFLCCCVLLLFSRSSFAVERSEYLVAIPRDFPPQYSLSSDGVPKGSTVEILDFVSRFSGVEFRFVVMDTWDEMLRALLGGEVDMIPNAGLSRARMKDYGVVFSEPLERFPVKTFVLKQNENTYGKLRLNDLKVGTVRSSFALTYLKRLGVHNITLFESIPDCVFALLSGEVDAVVYPQEPLLKIARDAGVAARVVQTGDSLFESKQGVAIAPGSAELLPLVNAALENIGGSGILSEIFDRWYVEKIPFWSARRVFFLMSLLLLLLTLSFFWWKTRFYRTTEEDLNARERAFMAHYNSVTSPTYTLQAKNDELGVRIFFWTTTRPSPSSSGIPTDSSHPKIALFSFHCTSANNYPIYP